MTGGHILRTAAAAALALAMATPHIAVAQDAEATTQELRLRQLEAGVRALQRQVFANGDGTTTAGSPAASPSTAMLTRMDALEASVARLTAQYEEMNNHLRQIDAKVGPGNASNSASSGAAAPAPLATAPAPLTPAASARPARVSATRLAAVKAVQRPESGDAAEDDYTYGFKLWQAKFYPEAEQQLQLFLEKYPHHARATYARNLVGRAYLDDGQQREAAKWFLKNYQTDQRGDRAPDSLLYLAQAMVELHDTSRACVALGQFSREYAQDAGGRLKEPYSQTRNSVTCN